MKRRNPHPLPVQRATKKRKDKEDKENELQYYRNHDPRINNIDRGYAEAGRLLPLFEEDKNDR